MIQLSILEEILQQVGHNIPIQELFDLAIGTSAGICQLTVACIVETDDIRWNHCLGAFQNELVC